MRRLILPALVAFCYMAPVRAAEFEELIPKGAKVEKLAGRMTFTEGPVWIGEGQGGYLVFSDIPANRLMKWQKGKLTVFRKDSNAANGNARDPQGRLITCEHSARRVTRTELGATKAHVLIDKYNGKKFNSPNDAAVKSDGSIWFTDPPYGLGDNDKEQPGNYVYRLDPETKQVKPVIQSMQWPNGICFSPDEKRLYVASSDDKDPLINVFDVNDDGGVGEGRVFCRIESGVPDGIRCDSEGRVWSSVADGVHVFSPEGKLLGKVSVPEPAANLCFGGEDGTTLFITARTSLYAVKTNVRGAGARNAPQLAPQRQAEALPSDFQWRASAPLVAPVERPQDPCYSVKDPSVVRYNDRWHLFCTIRSVKRSHQIEYLSFADWKDADAAERHVLKLSDGYFCAPQVFYFSPQKKWYMILQVSDPSGRPLLQPAYSTTDDIADPASWTKPELLYAKHPQNVKAWIDFWVICDDRNAHLFFTSNNGLLWRAQTKLSDFPRGWDEPRVVIKADIFEASCTYKLKAQEKYLTIVEAEAKGRPNGWRYYKGYVADALDEEWKPIADTWDKPFAGPVNVSFAGDRWTDSISHGELLREGYDEKLEVDPDNLRFLFQGVLERDRQGKNYGQIPWRLGILEPAREGA
jgi:sugar lactone lactonase YvrE